MWFGIGMLLVGLIFSNAVVLVSGALLFAFFLVQCIRFRRAVHTIRNSVSIESQASHIGVAAGDELEIETTVKNESNLQFRIIHFEHVFPAQIVTKQIVSKIPIQAHGQRLVIVFGKVTVPGRFASAKSVLVFEIGMRLFRHKVEFPDRVIITVHPLASKFGIPIDSTSMLDLTLNSLRQGPGTDFAGIRPSNFLDDFHRINWKVTARTGKLMTREFYREKDPTIILVIDISSSMKTVRNGTSTLNSLVAETGKLLTAFQAASPVGLISFDEASVITNIRARQGGENREKIVLALVDSTEPISGISWPAMNNVRSYSNLTKDAHLLEKELIQQSAAKPEWAGSFARTLLPYYQRAKSERLRKIRSQGVFRAFETVCNLPEPVLAVAISDGKTNLDGLYEGAKNAALAGHRVVLAILSDPLERRSADVLSELQGFGIQVFRIIPDQLWRTIDAATLQMSRIRQIHAAR